MSCTRFSGCSKGVMRRWGANGSKSRFTGPGRGKTADLWGTENFNPSDYGFKSTNCVLCKWLQAPEFLSIRTYPTGQYIVGPKKECLVRYDFHQIGEIATNSFESFLENYTPFSNLDAVDVQFGKLKCGILQPQVKVQRRGRVPQYEGQGRIVVK